MNLFSATLTCAAITGLSSLMYAAFPAPEPVETSYSALERAQMETFVSVQMPQEEIEFYVNETKREQLAGLYNVEPEHGR